MIQNFDISIIKYNLDLLNLVRKNYPFFTKYEAGEISSSSVMNAGLGDFASLIDLQKRYASYGINLFYDSVDIKDIKSKLIELTSNPISKRIISNKSHSKVLEIFTNAGIYIQYTRRKNKSYCDGIEKCLPMIISYLSIHKIPARIMSSPHQYTNKLTEPTKWKDELNNTSHFIDLMLEYAKSSDFDFRNSNVKIFTAEIIEKIKPLFLIESGLHVKCIKERDGFTVDNLYKIESSQVNYNGFLEVRIINDKGLINTLPYSPHFQEISKKREDMLSFIGI